MESSIEKYFRVGNNRKKYRQGGIKVRRLDTGEEFGTMKDAAKSLGVSAPWLSACLREGRPCGGVEVVRVCGEG